jgi:hypothetical protein
MKISLLILLGLTMAFMVQTGEGKDAFKVKRGECVDKENNLRMRVGDILEITAGDVKTRCKCLNPGDKPDCKP